MSKVIYKGHLQCSRFAGGEAYLRQLAYRMGIDIEIDKVTSWFTAHYYFKIHCEKSEAETFIKVMNELVRNMNKE